MFSEDKDNRIVVSSQGIGRRSEEAGSIDEHALQFDPSSQCEYITGSCFALEQVKILSENNWDANEIAQSFHTYRDLLIEYSEQDGFTPINCDGGDLLLSGALIDCLPHNIVKAGKDHYEFIDREWRSKAPVRLSYLLFRATVSLSKFAVKIAGSRSEKIKTWGDLLTLVYYCFGIRTDDGLLHEIFDLEATLRVLVFGHGDPNDYAVWMSTPINFNLPVSHRIDHDHEKNYAPSVTRTSEVSEMQLGDGN
ncbi:hypothetical protein WDZ92_45845, partial [Nostoc sp. NIES-2111]